jgi:small subunit ribosomal protein S15
MVQRERKQEIIKSFGHNEKDTGSTEVQIGLLTEKITLLTEHLKANKHDYASKRGLLKMVARRRIFLQYLERTNKTSYQAVCKALNL